MNYNYPLVHFCGGMGCNETHDEPNNSSNDSTINVIVYNINYFGHYISYFDKEGNRIEKATEENIYNYPHGSAVNILNAEYVRRDSIIEVRRPPRDVNTQAMLSIARDNQNTLTIRHFDKTQPFKTGDNVLQYFSIENGYLKMKLNDPTNMVRTYFIIRVLVLSVPAIENVQYKPVYREWLEKRLNE
jgi:hypothetical protein